MNESELHKYFLSVCPKWTVYNSYKDNYGMFDYKNKTVVDIGAEVGSTAVFFILRGAKKVYCVEHFQDNREIYASKVAKDLADIIKNKIEYVNFERLNLLGGDILKCDAEGFEQNLPPYYICRFKEYAIGVHRNLPEDRFMKLTNFLAEDGAHLHKIEGYERRDTEFLWVKQVK